MRTQGQTLSLRLRPAGRVHRGGINALALDSSGTLYSAGRDSTIQAWGVSARGQPAQHLATLDGHTDWVNDVILAGDDTVVSCSSDQVLP
jgi:WD repeat-containing protein 48